MSSEDIEKFLTIRWAQAFKSSVEELIDDGEINHKTTVAELLDILQRKIDTGE